MKMNQFTRLALAAKPEETKGGELFSWNKATVENLFQLAGNNPVVSVALRGYTTGQVDLQTALIGCIQMLADQNDILAGELKAAIEAAPGRPAIRW